MKRKVSRTRADNALHDAMHGDVESAQKAVADGANVNSQEEHSITPHVCENLPDHASRFREVTLIEADMPQK